MPSLTLAVPCLQRPYEIHSSTPIDEILNTIKVERVHYSSAWCPGMVALLKKVRASPSFSVLWCRHGGVGSTGKVETPRLDSMVGQ